MWWCLQHRKEPLGDEKLLSLCEGEWLSSWMSLPGPGESRFRDSRGCCGSVPEGLWGGGSVLCQMICAHWGPGEGLPLHSSTPHSTFPNLRPRNPREGSDLHETSFSALRLGRIREALSTESCTKSLTCGLRSRASGFSTRAWTLSSSPSLLSAQVKGYRNRRSDYMGPLRMPSPPTRLIENRLWAITRDPPVCVCTVLLHCPGSGH